MNEHVNFSETKSVLEHGDHMVPVFVQDADDYPTDCYIPNYLDPEDSEDQDDEVHFFEDVEE